MKTTKIAYELRGKIAERASIGLLALAEDATVESEWRYLLEMSGVRFFASRVPCAPEISPSTLEAMRGDLTLSMQHLVPGTHLDVVAYACTSASLVIGEEAVAKAIQRARPSVPVTTPLTAMKAALNSMNAQSIVLLTPYVDDINQRLRAHFEQCGIVVKAMASFFNPHDPEVVRISDDSIADAVAGLLRAEQVDAALVACTSLAGSRAIAKLEARFGVMVTTSNHAMAWHALRLAGVDDAIADKGRLFTLADKTDLAECS
ncbi:MAG: Asp/Glu racemase [Gammaproteobacteria bacterium]|nr:Asp/Glu racemase [Gammaproteobacteria bacterium]